MGESAEISGKAGGCGARVKRRIRGRVFAVKSVVDVSSLSSSAALEYEGGRSARAKTPPLVLVLDRSMWSFSPEAMAQIIMRASAPLDMSTSVPEGEGSCVVRTAFTKSVCPLRYTCWGTRVRACHEYTALSQLPTNRSWGVMEGGERVRHVAGAMGPR